MDSVVETRRGKLRGHLSDGVTAFKGVRYAAPPFGDEPIATSPACRTLGRRARCAHVRAEVASGAHIRRGSPRPFRNWSAQARTA